MLPLIARKVAVPQAPNLSTATLNPNKDKTTPEAPNTPSSAQHTKLACPYPEGELATHFTMPVKAMLTISMLVLLVVGVFLLMLKYR